MKGRKGLQHAGRQDAIKITLERETREYTTTGFGKFSSQLPFLKFSFSGDRSSILVFYQLNTEESNWSKKK